MPQYLIFEGLDAIGQMTLLTDAKVSSLRAQPTNGVWLGVWNHWKLQYLDDLG